MFTDNKYFIIDDHNIKKKDKKFIKRFRSITFNVGVTKIFLSIVLFIISIILFIDYIALNILFIFLLFLILMESILEIISYYDIKDITKLIGINTYTKYIRSLSYNKYLRLRYMIGVTEYLLLRIPFPIYVLIILYQMEVNYGKEIYILLIWLMLLFEIHASIFITYYYGVIRNYELTINIQYEMTIN